MKGRIIFVGVHNKPGMEPLDSRTKSGKIIDEVIAGLPGREWLKSNLFDRDEMPCKDDEHLLYYRWLKKVNPCDFDIVVALGSIVKKHFPTRYCSGASVIIVPHPASRHIKKDEYVKQLIDKILNT